MTSPDRPDPADRPDTADLPDGLTLGPPARGTDGTAPAPAMLVLPGGGYGMHAPHEAEPIAEWLAGLGFHTFLLRYPVSPDEGAEPLLARPVESAVAAMRAIRSGAAGHRVDPTRVGVLGFSAGGHLAATLSQADVVVGAADAVPDFAVLCYPVISLTRQAHVGSVHRLVGPDPGLALIERFSPEHHVHPRNPPTFLWHTANDAGVPVSHSLAYAAALAGAEVPVELHVFPDGAHGLGLATDDPAVGQWVGLCERWLAGVARLS